MEQKSKNQYLDILQILRGIAALMVVIHHTVGSLNYYHNINNNVLNALGKFGKFGVDFFFILSGFIISYATYYKYKSPNNLQNYIKNRLIRVYIPYFPIGITMYILYTYFPGFSNNQRDISFLTTLTLLPNGNPALSVAWTLTFELFFYFVFAITFFSRKSWNYFVVIWTIVILLFNYTNLNTAVFSQNAIFRVFISTYNLEFIIGYLLSLLIIIYQIKISLKQISIVIVLLFLAFLLPNFFSIITPYFYSNFLFSCFSFLMLYILINIYNKKVNQYSIMMFIGNASYSIYLIHNPLQMMILRMYPKIKTNGSLILSIIIVLFLSCLFGYIYYLIFEKKCVSFLKSKILK
jgi:exopolysaccharide production protein ExoZ